MLLDLKSMNEKQRLKEFKSTQKVFFNMLCVFFISVHIY